MAISDSAKVDLLYKKLFGVTKTDTPTNKSPSNEAIASPALLRGDIIWQQAASIPAIAAAVPSIVEAYTTTARIECVADTTTTPVSSRYPTWKTNLADWIPPEFGSTYFIKVYADDASASDPTVTGTQLSDSGIAGVGEWNFDYQSGVLNFIGGTIPSALTVSKVIYITGYRYIGSKGITTFSNGISISNGAITGGYIDSLANITANTGNVGSMYIAELNSTIGNIDTLYVTNFSTGNAVISGGYVTNLSNITVINSNVVNLYTANLNVTNGNINTLYVTNFSTANAIIRGGLMSGVSIEADYFLSGNATIAGGNIYNVNVQAISVTTSNAYLGNLWIYDETITGLNLDQDIIIAPRGIGNVSVNNAVITNVGEPLSSQDAATKNYVDSTVSATLYPAIGTDDSFVTVIDDGIDPGNVVVTVDGTDVAWFTLNSTQIANVLISGNTISSTGANLVISANTTADANNIVIFDSVSAFNIPTGNTEQRPGSPDDGYVRFNTDTHTVEWWAVDRWIAGAQTIVQQTITPDGFNSSFTLIQGTSTESILVNINGTVQQPYTSYEVIGEVLLQLAEVPELTDIIEVRFLNTGIARTTYDGGNVYGAVHILDTSVSTSSNTGALIVEGGVGIVGNLSIDGRVHGNLIPGIDAYFSIGSSALRWLDLYTAGTTVHDGPVNIYNNVTVSGDVGASTLTGTLVSGNQPAIVEVGTIVAGGWQGSAIGIAYGGTGATSQAGALNNLLPTGEQAGYVLTTGGAGSYYWAQGGTGGGGGGGGTLSGIFNQSARTYYIATGGQTTFNTESNFTPGTSQLRVYQNGVRQFESEYTETNGNTFVLSTACAAGDLILAEIDGYNSLVVYANVSVYEPSGGIISSANTVQLAIDNLESRKVNRSGDTMTGALIIANTTQATSTTSGALRVQGGASFESGNVYIGGANGNAIIATGNIYGTRVFSMGSNVLIPSSNVATQVSSLGVGTAASGTIGEIRATNDIIAYYSDDRLKTRLGTIDNALDKVNSLTGFYYQANDVAQSLGYAVKREVGISAQDVQKVLPEIIAEAPIDSQYMTLKYEKLIPVLIEAIKELSNEINELKRKL